MAGEKQTGRQSPGEGLWGSREPSREGVGEWFRVWEKEVTSGLAMLYKGKPSRPVIISLCSYYKLMEQ